MSNILVTGGAGCIGSDLVQRLLDLDHRVTVIDNLSSGKQEHIAPYQNRNNFTFIPGDLLNPNILDDALTGVDIVYHLAANPDVKFVPGEATDKDLRQNTLATYNVLEAMRRKDVRQLVFASTSAVYGIAPTLPIPEDMAPMRPISLYGATKLSCEAMIGAFQHLFGMRCWILRFANVVGPKVRKRGRTVISDFIYNLRQNPRDLNILGNGRQEKSYLHTSDCVDGILFAVAHAPGDLNVYNLGGPDSLSVDEIASMIVKALALKEVRFHYTGTEGGWPGDVPRFRLDVSAMNQLGWKAKYNSRDSVAMTIEAMLAQNLGEMQAQGDKCRQ